MPRDEARSTLRMAAVTPSLLVQVLRAPTAAAGLGNAQWDLLVRQARRAALLPRLAQRLGQAGVCAPSAAQRHLDVALALARVQRDEVWREIRLLLQVLAPLQVPVVLLKGAAYVAADLPPAQARLFSDIDILVPRPRLGEVEASLLAHGWAPTHLSAYDQRYYREWMHELPPLVHIQRQTTLDVHHNILPSTARTVPEAERLLAAAVPLDEEPRLRVLCTEDRVLHSMSHLFHNDDLSHALRDLSDLDLLLREHPEGDPFWSQLLRRARQLQLTRPLHDGLRYAARVLHTPVPAAVVDEVKGWGRPAARQALMDALWRRALAPRHDSCDDALSPVARGALYLRAHWLRMPPAMLVRHLTVKALGLHTLPETGGVPGMAGAPLATGADVDPHRADATARPRA